MPSALAALAGAFALVALAEFGDKSQLLLVAQAGRQPAARVLAEAAAAFALLAALAAAAGAAVAAAVPAAWAALLSGLLFLLFGGMALREARASVPAEGEAAPAPRRGSTFVLLVAAEMGDKTQLATAALAASSGHAWATGLGAFLALLTMAALAVAAGAWLRRRLAPRARAYGAAALFLAVGAATVAWALLDLLG